MLQGNRGLGVAPSRIQGLGVFALAAMDAETLLLRYQGPKVHLGEDGRVDGSRNPRTLALMQAGLAVDGDHPENEARWINHSCEPNAQMIEQQGELIIVSNREIAEGEEITINYGYTAAEALRRPCRCGASGCAGYQVGQPWRGALLRLRAHQSRNRRTAATPLKKNCR